MPRPRQKKEPLEVELEDVPDVADEEEYEDGDDAAEGFAPTQSQEQQLATMKSLPDTLAKAEKEACMNWLGGCFCCPAVLSFGQSLAFFMGAARRQPAGGRARRGEEMAPDQERDSELTHWGLNLCKFLFPSGGRERFGCQVLHAAGLFDVAPPLLSVTSEFNQNVQLTPAPGFVAAFNTSRSTPCSSSVQLVTCLLVQLATMSDARTLRAAIVHTPLVAKLVRSLEETADDRYRSAVAQLLTHWLTSPLLPLGPAPAGQAPEAAAAGGYGEREALVGRLVGAGVAKALTACVLRASASAPVLRDTCQLVMGLLTGTDGTSGGGHHGPPLPPGVPDYGAAELGAGVGLRGEVRAAARDALLQAGVIPSLLALLERPPSAFSYWLPINLGVNGARYLELQRWGLVVARTCLLPVQSAAEAEAAHDPDLPELVPAQAAPQAPPLLRLAVALVGRSPALQGVAAEEAEEAGGASGAAAAAGGTPVEKAVATISRAVALSSAGLAAPGWLPLEELPVAERDHCPDWRMVHMERARKAAEQARAAQSQAGASQAVDVLSRALQDMPL